MFLYFEKVHTLRSWASREDETCTRGVCNPGECRQVVSRWVYYYFRPPWTSLSNRVPTYCGYLREVQRPHLIHTLDLQAIQYHVSEGLYLSSAVLYLTISTTSWTRDISTVVNAFIIFVIIFFFCLALKDMDGSLGILSLKKNKKGETWCPQFAKSRTELLRAVRTIKLKRSLIHTLCRRSRTYRVFSGHHLLDGLYAAKQLRWTQPVGRHVTCAAAT